MHADQTPRPHFPALLGVAIVSCLVTAGVTLQVLKPAPGQVFEPVAVLASKKTDAAWIVSTDSAHHHLHVRVLPASLELPRVLDLQLWAKGQDGETVPLGLLQLTDGETQLPPLTLGQIDALRHARSLLISAEPLGGSAQPAPSGPVLYSGKLKG